MFGRQCPKAAFTAYTYTLANTGMFINKFIDAVICGSLSHIFTAYNKVFIFFKEFFITFYSNIYQNPFAELRSRTDVHLSSKPNSELAIAFWAVFLKNYCPEKNECLVIQILCKKQKRSALKSFV